MKVEMTAMYERAWNEMRQLHERCLIAEQAVDDLEKENMELKQRLSESEGASDTNVEGEDAYLEKLKAEVKD